MQMSSYAASSASQAPVVHTARQVQVPASPLLAKRTTTVVPPGVPHAAWTSTTKNMKGESTIACGFTKDLENSLITGLSEENRSWSSSSIASRRVLSYQPSFLSSQSTALPVTMSPQVMSRTLSITETELSRSSTTGNLLAGWHTKQSLSGSVNLVPAISFQPRSPGTAHRSLSRQSQKLGLGFSTVKANDVLAEQLARERGLSTDACSRMSTMAPPRGGYEDDGVTTRCSTWEGPPVKSEVVWTGSKDKTLDKAEASTSPTRASPKTRIRRPRSRPREQVPLSAKIFERSPSPVEVNRAWSQSLCPSHNQASSGNDVAASPFVIPRDRSKERVEQYLPLDPTKMNPSRQAQRGNLTARSEVSTARSETTERIFGTALRDPYVENVAEETFSTDFCDEPVSAYWSDIKLARSRAGEILLQLQEGQPICEGRRFPPAEAPRIRREKVISRMDQLGCQTLMFEPLQHPQPVRTRSSTPSTGWRDTVQSVRHASLESRDSECASARQGSARNV